CVHAARHIPQLPPFPTRRSSDLPALAQPHVIVIDNVLGTYFRPESGIRTIVGVPCQEWDLDPDAPMVLAPSAPAVGAQMLTHRIDRKSTRLNSSHVAISYAVFCL